MFKKSFFVVMATVIALLALSAFASAKPVAPVPVPNFNLFGAQGFGSLLFRYDAGVGIGRTGRNILIRAAVFRGDLDALEKLFTFPFVPPQIPSSVAAASAAASAPGMAPGAHAGTPGSASGSASAPAGTPAPAGTLPNGMPKTGGGGAARGL